MKNIHLLPTEKPKQEMRKVCKCKRAYENPLSEICSLCWNELYPNEKDEIKDEDLLESKQETLEEVAEEFYSEQSKSYEDDIEPMFDTSRYLVAGFIEGAKWQAERMEKLKDFDTWKEWKNTGII